MAAGIQYETPVDVPHLPMVSAGPDEIVLTMRPTPLWINVGEIFAVGLFLCINGAYLALMAWVHRTSGQGVDPSQMLTFAGLEFCFLIFEIYQIAKLLRRYRRGPIPRQLAVSADSFRLISAPVWRVLTRCRPLSDVRDVRLRNLKNVIGRPAGAILSVRFIRGPIWQFRFNEKHAAIAAEAHRLIRERVECRNPH